MTPALEASLLERFPAIFAVNDDYLEKGVTEYYPIECGDGWFSLIQKTCEALDGLARHYLTFGYVSPKPMRAWVFADQSHKPERDGLLRFEIAAQLAPLGEPMTHAIRRGILADGMVWMASVMSASVCEVCGNPGRHARRRVRCAAHVDVSTQDAAARATADVAKLVAFAQKPGVKGVFLPVPTKKRTPRT